MKILSAICAVLLLASCNTKTRSSEGDTMPLVDTLNLPGDSLAFYFPVNSFSDKPNEDSFVQNWYSSALYSYKEQNLSKGYLGHVIYRFLWLRSFHRPVVFTFHKKDDQVWMVTKMLDRQPPFYEERIDGVTKEEQEMYIKSGFIADSTEPDLMVRKADRKANIIYNKITLLSEREWNDFDQLLEKANYWNLPTNMGDNGADGSSWIIEAHLESKYHLVDYHNPYKNEFANLGLFLIKLSGLNEKVY